MSIHVPQGGFLSVVEPDPSVRSVLEQGVRAAGGCAVHLAGTDLLLAAWSEYSGQGLWTGEEGAAAYDLDLTNVRELRAQSATDEASDPGELLLHLYRRYGLEFLDRLRGAFGFALWDGRERRLVVATDPYGIRAVVHTTAGEAWLAGSRIRHLLLHPGTGREIDPEAIYHYLFYSAIPTPATIYRHIQKLAPGTYLDWDRRGQEPKRYYDIRYAPDTTVGETYWKRAIPLQVRRAVAHCVPLSDPEHTGCFLSGGTDSSSVAGYYTQVCGRPAKTFTIGFDEPGYDEMGFARLAARHFGTEPFEYYVTPADVRDLVHALPDLYDEPFGNSSVVPAYFCAKLAREAGVEVLLAGDGGDEIFGGNERYVTNLVFERYHLLPAWARKGLLEPLLGALPGVGPVYKAQRYVRRAGMPNPDRFFSYNLLAETPADEIFTAAFLGQVDTDCFLKIARAHFERASPAHATDRLLYLDMKFTVTDNDLRKVTQMAESAGARVRYPFLDRDLVDFSSAIPPDLKVKPGRGRYMFKRAMEGFLPQEIIDKTKHGFGLPVGPWFQKDPQLSRLLDDTLFSPEACVKEYLREDFLNRVRDHFKAGEVSYYGANLWVFLMLELWLRGRRS